MTFFIYKLLEKNIKEQLLEKNIKEQNGKVGNSMAEEMNINVEEQNINTETEQTNTESNNNVDIQAQLQQLMVENAKLKRQNDKSSAEASDYKKKWKASMSEVELANQEKAEREALRDEEFNALKRENSINKAEKTFIALGYTSAEAEQMAIAEIDGDLDAKLKIMAQVEERKRKEYESEFIKSRPQLNSGVGEESDITREQFNKMSYKSKVELRQNNPDLYNKLTI